MTKNPALMLLFAGICAGIFALAEYPKWRNYNDGFLHIYFFNVGQGDSALIKFPNKSLVLIDAGPNDNVLYELSDAIPFWISKIDMVVLTHSHADHISGALDVLERYEVGCIAYRVDDEAYSETELRLREIINDYEIPSGVDRKCVDGIENHFVLAEVLGESTDPEFKRVAEDNQNFESITTLVTYYDFDVLFTGDAEEPVQKSVIKKINKDIEVIKVPHQGSSDSFYPPLLDKLRPELGVVSVGKNSYGHPHKEVLEGYKELGIRLLRTDEDGTVHIRSDGRSWQILQ